MNKKISPFVVFRYPDFTYVWWGVLIAQIGSEAMIVAINWQIYLITKSPLSLGLIGAARFIPLLLFSLFAGLAADILNRKKLIFAAQLVLMLVALFLAILTFTQTINAMLIYALVTVYAIANVFNGPARQSILPHLVPREYFLQAVSMNALIWQTATIIGPSIAGLVIGFIGVGQIYAFAAITFCAVNISMILIKQIPKNENMAEFSLKSIKTGVTFVRNTPLIWSTMILDFFATFFASATTLMPVYAKDILKVGAQGLGFLYAAPAIGSVICGFIFSSFHKIGNQGKILLFSVFLYGLSTIFFGISHVFAFSLIMLFVSGAADSLSSIIRNTIRQLATPDHLRGRMSSINMMFYAGGPQLGEVEAGIAASFLGTPLSVVIGGIGTIIATAYMAKSVPKLRDYNNHNEFKQ